MNEYPSGAHHEPQILRFPSGQQQAAQTLAPEFKAQTPVEPTPVTQSVLVFSPRPVHDNCWLTMSVNAA